MLFSFFLRYYMMADEETADELRLSDLLKEIHLCQANIKNISRLAVSLSKESMLHSKNMECMKTLIKENDERIRTLDSFNKIWGDLTESEVRGLISTASKLRADRDERNKKLRDFWGQYRIGLMVSGTFTVLAGIWTLAKSL